MPQHLQLEANNMKTTYTYHVKNMVCQRCILIVNDILASLRIEAKLALGRISVAEKLEPTRERGMAENLRSVGLEVIESRVNRLIEEVKQAVREYLALGSDAQSIKLSSFVSSHLHYEFSYLSDLFSKEEGITVERFFILQRMEKVKALIACNQFSMSEIAFETGFSSVHHLSAQFKKIFGSTPSQYKAQTFREQPTKMAGTRQKPGAYAGQSKMPVYRPEPGEYHMGSGERETL